MIGKFQALKKLDFPSYYPITLLLEVVIPVAVDVGR